MSHNTNNINLKISKLLPKCKFPHLKQIHALIITTPSLIQTLPNFLRRATEFGSMDYPDIIFSQMGDDPNIERILLWNVMIRGYAFNGPFIKCLKLFDEMPHRGLKPDNYTYPYVFHSCSELGLWRGGEVVHSQVVKSGFGLSNAVAQSLFDMYVKKRVVSKCGLSDVVRVFDGMVFRPVGMWNRMMYEYIKDGDVVKARALFDAMQERDIVSWNSMISGYLKAGELEKARELFDLMPEKNVISWTSMIGLYADVGDLESARKCFVEMLDKNVVSWNSMISCCNKHGKFREALDLFEQMQAEGMVPDGYTFVSVLLACSNLCALDYGKYVHYLIGDLSKLEVMVATSLVEMYAQCGDVNRSFSIFVKTPNKDVFCWNVMIKSLAINGRAEDAVKLFYLLQKKRVRPNEYTFSSALFACSHGGLVEEGRKIFNSMEKEYKISPKVEHFCCFIDLLCRNGHLEEAKKMGEAMPFRADIAIWGALLGGCRAEADLNYTEKIMEGATESATSEPGVYALWSNIKASGGQWVEAMGVRTTMEDKNIRKIAGISSLC